MKTFLEYVARDMIEKYGFNMSRVAVIFPNKRASLFLNEHLVRIAGKPIWSPTFFTLRELFSHNSSLEIADEIKLVIELYQSYTSCTNISETLDHFWSWGELLLSDFDDIDKQMVRADTVLANVKDIHALDDDSYLTQEQREALKAFFLSMRDGSSSELQARFLRIWSHLTDIYHDFKARLREKGIAYEGMLCREVIENKEIDTSDYDIFIFVGFGHIMNVEKQLFSLLKDQGKARFYWDFDFFYTHKREGLMEPNEAGRSIPEYLRNFPNELDNHSKEIYDNFYNGKKITFVAANTENSQARYVGGWLKENERYKRGTHTAVVLCNESLLPNVIHSMPEEVEKINVTIGFPLSLSPLNALIEMLLELQVRGWIKDRGFRTNYVVKILSHPYSRYLSLLSGDLLSFLKDKKPYCCSLEGEFLNDDSLITLLEHQNSNTDIASWISRLLKSMALRVGFLDKEEDLLLEESLFKMYTIFNRITAVFSETSLEINPITFQKLVTQMISSYPIPYNGEPAEGVQIMSVLEARNLDFENVLILSCNEGNLPKKSGDVSFIPYFIRKAHNLTDQDRRVESYSYNFHCLIQRAKDVTITYNNSTENGTTGEMSRFMLQLLAESNFNIERRVITLKPELYDLNPRDIPKDSVAMNILKEIGYLSPTAINRYLRCPLQFYFYHIAKIREKDEKDEDETLDSRAFGNIFHNAAEYVYRDNTDVKEDIDEKIIDKILKDKELISSAVDKAMHEELYGKNWQGPYPEYDGLALINREVIIRFITRLLKVDKGLSPFRILKLEEDVFQDIDIKGKDKPIRVGGRIDRLDEVIDKESGGKRIRVIDYKTGRSEPKVKDVDSIFSRPFNPTHHTDYCLQSMLYSMIVRDSSIYNPKHLGVSPSLLYIQHASQEEYDPTIKINAKPLTDISDYKEEFLEKLKEVLSEVYNPE
ncbi:MAG: PD-(D/E)XK nuclease family protein, partial [Prevotella sp.]|nr:PD-(D/E)XK nuclease family protein [Prevotella sp.]